MFLANDKNYNIDIRLFWGSYDKNIEAVSDAKNGAQLRQNSIKSFEMTSSLLVPWISGSFEYEDQKKSSPMPNMMDIPIIYGRIDFCQFAGPGGNYSASTQEPYEQETFSEYVVINSFNVVEDTPTTTTFKFFFSMADSVVFKSNMNPVSTFTDDKRTKKLKDLIKEMFAASNTKPELQKFDYDTINPCGVEIPFITSCNSTFMDSIEYVYRKVFDDDFENRNGKSFCKIVYNNGKRQYEWWNFSDVGTDKMFKCDSSDMYYKGLREKIAVELSKTSVETKNSAALKFAGDAADLHNIFGIKSYTKYDYLKNAFEDIVDANEDIDFIDHEDAMYQNQKNKAFVVKMNSSLFPELIFNNTYSSYRDNGSLYDIFNEMIFASPYMHVVTPGCIGRYAGNGIDLKFVSSELSPYKFLEGAYIITGITHHLVNNGDQWSFTSEMDVFKPYCVDDSLKQENP